jgi:hypothetical protein
MTLAEFIKNPERQTNPAWQSTTEKFAAQVVCMDVGDGKVMDTQGLENKKVRAFLCRIEKHNGARYKTRTLAETGELEVLRVF